VPQVDPQAFPLDSSLQTLRKAASGGTHGPIPPVATSPCTSCPLNTWHMLLLLSDVLLAPIQRSLFRAPLDLPVHVAKGPAHAMFHKYCAQEVLGTAALHTVCFKTSVGGCNTRTFDHLLCRLNTRDRCRTVAVALTTHHHHPCEIQIAVATSLFAMLRAALLCTLFHFASSIWSCPSMPAALQ
jgi:hypothetical protein